MKGPQQRYITISHFKHNNYKWSRSIHKIPMNKWCVLTAAFMVSFLFSGFTKALVSSPAASTESITQSEIPRIPSHSSHCFCACVKKVPPRGCGKDKVSRNKNNILCIHIACICKRMVIITIQRWQEQMSHAEELTGRDNCLWPTAFHSTCSIVSSFSLFQKSSNAPANTIFTNLNG